MNVYLPIKQYVSQKSERIVFWFIFIIAILTRLILLNRIPDGLNQDEAFAAYESFSIFTTGMDSGGDRFSIYPPTWGQGMSVLYAYLTVPFFALFGVNTLAVRLPQALLGILSCFLFFRLVTLMYNKRVGYIAFFMSAIMPWHIMMSRYGMEVNSAPFFILAGFYFFIKSFQSTPYLLISSFFYGLGIYAYDCCAIYIAFSFLFQLICRLCSEFNKKTLFYAFLSGCLFSLIISPFLLLVAVNNDIIPPIKDIITIPKMHFWKQGKVGFSGFFRKLDDLWRILCTGSDNRIQNVINKFGILYPLSLPFIMIGLYTVLHDVLLNAKNKRNNIILFGTIIVGILYAGTIGISVSRVNFLWFNVIFLLAIGINYLFTKKRDLILILALYFCFFVSFSWCYFTQYSIMSKHHFSSGLEKSLQVALDEHKISEYPIYVISHPEVYPKILFWNKIKPQDFRKTVKWRNPDATYLHAKSFLFYHVEPNFECKDIIHDAIYIVPLGKKNCFSNSETKKFGNFVLVIPKK